jgi:hypothetical protein
MVGARDVMCELDFNLDARGKWLVRFTTGARARDTTQQATGWATEPVGSHWTLEDGAGCNSVSLPQIGPEFPVAQLEYRHYNPYLAV